MDGGGDDDDDDDDDDRRFTGISAYARITIKTKLTGSEQGHYRATTPIVSKWLVFL